MDEREFLILGKVKTPVGTRGEVRVKSAGEPSAELKRIRTVLVGETPYEVEYVRLALQQEAIVLKLKGVDDRDAAYALCDQVAACRWADAPELPSGTHYIHDLIGLAVYDESDVFVGTVLNVLVGKQPCYEIAHGMTAEEVQEAEAAARIRKAENDAHMKEFRRRLAENPGAVPNAEKAIKAELKKLDAGPAVKTFLVPIVDEYVVKTDKKNGKLYLKGIQGLIEL